MLIAIAVIVIFSLTVIGLSFWALAQDSPWWLPAVLIVGFIVAGWIVFSWLFLPLAVCLFLMVFWFKNSGTAGMIISSVLALAIIAGAFFLIAPAIKAKTVRVTFQPPITVTTSGSLVTPTVTKTSSSAPVVAADCTEAISIESQIHGGKVELDLNDGDPFNYSLTVISPDMPTSPNTLVVLTEPGSIFDVIHPVMYFTSYRLEGTLDQALCSASKLAGDKALAYVFVGKATTPNGWTTVSTEGWWTELVAKQYSEKAITIGVDSLPFQIAADDKNRDLVSLDVLHGQLWDPTPAKDEKLTVVHPEVGKGYTLVVPVGWEGTYWTISNGNSELVQARIIQTSKEVVERDGVSINPNDYGHMVLLYCGDPNTVPTTELKIGNDTLKWVTSLAGWTCEVTPK